MPKKEQGDADNETPDSPAHKVDLEALNRITSRVLAYRPSQRRKPKQRKQGKQQKPKPPPE